MKISSTVLLVASLGIATAAVAQELPKMPSPVKEHEWLQQFVGAWESVTEASMGPGQLAIQCQGTMNAKMLGGFWLLAEYEADMMGQRMKALQTIGYDTSSKKYAGTWVDSIMNHMWKYEGAVDKTGKILTLDADGPNFLEEGKIGKFRDAYEFKSKDHIVLTSSMLGPDGKWVTFMTGNLRRKK